MKFFAELSLTHKLIFVTMAISSSDLLVACLAFLKVVAALTDNDPKSC